MSSLPSILIGFGLLLAGILGVLVSVRRGGPIVFTSPSYRARRRLERALGLGLRDRMLLERLARVINERDCTCLLIGRGCFEAAVAAYAPRERALPRIESLRQRIFATAPEEHAVGASS